MRQQELEAENQRLTKRQCELEAENPPLFAALQMYEDPSSGSVGTGYSY